MLAPLLALALSVGVGDPAPPITAPGWVGDAPDLQGKAVLVEFWGTWCAPCVATMPHVQELWTRYREQGLVVVGVSFENAAVLKGFMDKKGWTMPVATDTEKALVAAFEVESWPTTFVIGKDGKILFRGWPLGAEPFVQQALGLETAPDTLLSRYVEGAGDPKGTLESLARNASRQFALGEWAKAHGGAPSPRPPKDAGEALSNVAVGWGSVVGIAALGDLAAVEQPFDLRGWAQRELATRFPIGDDEVKLLLEAERYADVLAAIVTRNPSEKALAKAKADDGLRDWCHERVAQYTENASLVVLLGHWAFGEYKQPPEIHFPPGVGMLTGEGGKGFEGVKLNTGEQLVKGDFPSCIEPFLATSVAIQSLAKRKLPGDLPKAAAKLHDDLLGDLKKQYGTEKAEKPENAD